MKFWGSMTLVCALALVSCADKSEDNGSQNDDALQPVQPEGQTAFEVDATSRTEWVGLDLDQSTFVNAASLPSNTVWDLAFKRTSIKLAGSVAIRVVDQDYSALTAAPADGYISDQPATEPGAPETAGLAFHQDPAWYVYDINTHIVSSRGLVYVIKSGDGRYFKLRLTDYYNAARLPAYINMEFQELKGVAP